MRPYGIWGAMGRSIDGRTAVHPPPGLIETNWPSEISRTGGRMAMRPYGIGGQWADRFMGRGAIAHPGFTTIPDRLGRAQFSVHGKTHQSFRNSLS